MPKVFKILFTVEDFKHQKAIEYPNPTNGIINIENGDFYKIQVYDITGKKIKEFAPQTQNELSNVAKGIYFLKLISERGILVNKIILE